MNPKRDLEIMMNNVDTLSINSKEVIESYEMTNNHSQNKNVDINEGTKANNAFRNDVENPKSIKTVQSSIMLENCYLVDSEGLLNCKYCVGKYKREGHMKNHIETKHNLKINLSCKCGQIFDDTTRYVRHRKNCR